MNFRSFVALSVLFAVTLVVVGPPWAAHSQTRTSRAPLAMLAGEVPWPDDVRAETAPRGTAANGILLDQTAVPVLLTRLPPDSLLVALMDSTSLSNVTSTIQHMQDYGSRYVAVDSCWAAGYWIRDQFIEYGLTEVELDTFRCWTFQDTVDAMNVLAWKEGISRPDEYVVIGGHYDSVTTDNFTDPNAPAPGADDNGTGIAGVLEAARLLAGLDLERSVIFACWSGEELGLRGSRAWVNDAVAAGLDIVIYLNMDCLGYPDEPDPAAIVYSDSSSLAVAALMCDLITENTDYGCATRVQPIGASDQNSFWEAGYNVLDTSAGAGWSPYHHTPNDVIENVDLPICRALAAVNVATGAAVAGVVGEEPNLPPETVLTDNCAATHLLLTLRPLFEWSAVDFDGHVALYEYRVVPLPEPAAPVCLERESVQLLEHAAPVCVERTWIELPLGQTSIVPPGLTEGDYRFEVRAVDDSGIADPSPASHTFTATGALCPILSMEMDFTRETVEFSGHWSPGSVPRVRVFEGERLVFGLEATADAYCGVADAVAVAIGDTVDWSDWENVPHDFVVVPEPGDTAIHFLTEDENGSRTMGKMVIATTHAGMDLPLLHVDDWFGQPVSDAMHDAFYDSILSGLEHDTWDPYEHISGIYPNLPSMQDLAGYRTVLWSLGAGATLLHPAQSESGYHAIEGFVRAGGNLIIEGHSPIEALAANDQYQQWRVFGDREFVHDHAGIDSMYNTGSLSDPGNPGSYGYAFLGGISIAPWSYSHLPVDTLVKWQEGYAIYGGLPSCEVYRPSPATMRLYLFDAYLNAGLDEKPCATLTLPDDGTGSVAVLGFPLYYIETDAAKSVIEALLTNMIEWQQPAALISFRWEDTLDSVSFTWYLSPPDNPLGCHMERRLTGSDDDYALLTTSPLSPDATGWYHYTDTSPVGWTDYSYRLRVLERCGTTTIHGPWNIALQSDTSVCRLFPPFPNPTTRETVIRYVVDADHRWTSVDVFSLDGRLVRSLFEGPREAGGYTAYWDGTDNGGENVAGGVYFVRARIGVSELERKVVVLR
jgi:hypothetical protein